jgi:predicted NBD/HSP70 family sugar kinase
MISRAEIARLTGLTPATVSNITAELLSLHIIEERARGESSGGRKPVILSIAKNAYSFAGVHIGTDMIEVALADCDAEIKQIVRLPFKGRIDPETAMDRVGQMLETVIGQSELPVTGIGVCVHGLVNSEEGISVFAPNLRWEHIPVGPILQERFHLPVYVENDVRAMTLAENWCGIARNVKDYVYLYIGPGIGGSIVLNNEIYKGSTGFAGEFGHSTIEPDGPLCTCGNHGCLQAFASEDTVLNNYIGRVNDRQPNLEYADLVDRAAAGEEAALDEILKSVRYIGIEVGNIINAINPPLIVINAKFAKLGDRAMRVIREEVGRRAMKYAQNGTDIVFSGLGENAPIRGAATCIVRQMFASPRSFFLSGDVD